MPKTEKIKFNVYAQNNEPIEQVTVQFIFDGAPAPRVTDSNGYVSIEIPRRDEVEVVLSKGGFKTLRQTINVNADTNKTVTFYLEKNSAPTISTTSSEPKLEEQKVVGLRYDMKYGSARSLLIEQGWQPRTFSSNGDIPKMNESTLKYLLEQGFIEVVACSGTGRGFCRFEFNNTKGETLVVVTVGNDPMFGGSRVERWWIETEAEKSPYTYEK